MRLRVVLVLLVLISGLGLAGFVYMRWAAKPAPVAAEVAAPPPMVIAAAEQISTGMLIKPSQLKFVPTPPDAVIGTYFDRARDTDHNQQDIDDRTTMNAVAGAVARKFYQPDQPITHESVVKPGDSGFLAAVLLPGMRAVTIGVTAVSGAAGLVYPGDKVDLILTQNIQTTGLLGGGAGGNQTTSSSTAETVATDIRVIAIDQQLQAGASQTGGKLAQTVTMEVTPRQAAQIALASKLGEISLSIRSLQPGTGLDSAGTIVWAADLAPPTKNVQRQGSQKILVIRGNDQQTVQTQP